MKTPPPIPEIEGMQDVERSLQRVYAWYEQEMLDRPPIRFSEHNAEYLLNPRLDTTRWSTLKDRWFDAEYQVEHYLRWVQGQTFLAESFPVFWPNLGPEVYGSFFGGHLEYQEVTSYAVPCVDTAEDIENLHLDLAGNPYYAKIEEMTDLALDRCPGKCLVGYTDLHPGMDCVAGWRDPQQLCMDLILDPDKVSRMVDLANRKFQPVYDHYDARLKARGQLSVAWMRIPSYGKMHIPSCDFSSMISTEHFLEFCLPAIRDELAPMTHNIFHVDGRGVARHLDLLLELPEINAIQWVQGVGEDQPISMWTDLIHRVQDAGKSIVVDLAPNELESFIDEFRPEGIYLCMTADPADQPDIVRRVESW